ncbi:MAG: transporter substrate-binding domain-containing protein [Chloroflexi bacterium]|nr:transporter substrate-binding domain-containing protein [Chloroflexota bacterium]MCC6891287.1 transporter substrate-binding domain-containing protein [Anaerolineae bacterium]
MMGLRHRRVLFVILMLVLMIPTLGTVIAQESAATVAWPDLGGREITVAVENAYPPYNSIVDGVGVGWDYDTFTAICQLLNCVPVFEEVAWDGMLLGIANGQYDVAADGITYTAERDQTVDFSQLYQAYDETLLIREDDTRFTTSDELKSLDDFLVGTQIGTTNEITAKTLFGDDHVRSFEQFGPAIEALKNDDVDAVVVDRPAAEGYIAAQGGLKTLPESLSGIQGLAFAYPPGSDLVYPVNAAMSALQASGTWDEIFNKWFNSAS